MWLLVIDLVDPKDPKNITRFSVPLRNNHSHRIGRSAFREGKTVRNDVVLSMMPKLSRAAGRVDVGKWPNYGDNEEEVDWSPPTLTFHNELVKPNKLPTQDTDPTNPNPTDPSIPAEKKAIRVGNPHRTTPRGSRNDEDYDITNEVDFFEIKDGGYVQLAINSRLYFEWHPIILTQDKRTAAEASVCKKLEAYGVGFVNPYQLKTSTHLLTPLIKDNVPCFSSVSSSNPIVLPSYASDLLTAIETSIDSFQQLGDKEEFASPDVAEYVPELDAKILEVKEMAKKDWWKVNKERTKIWIGKTIVLLTNNQPTPEIQYLKNMGAHVMLIDIITKPLKTSEDLLQRLRKPTEESKRIFQAAIQSGEIPADSDEKERMVVAIKKAASTWYEESEMMDMDTVFMGPLDQIFEGMYQFLEEAWFRPLTSCDWKQFCELDPDDESGDMRQTAAQSQARSRAGPSQFEVTPTQLSEAPSVPAASGGGTFIPSTHPEEQDAVAPELPEPPRRPLKRRAGRGAPQVDDFDPFAEDPVETGQSSKRQRVEEPVVEPPAAQASSSSAMAIDEQSTNAPSGAKLKRRARGQDADMLSMMFGLDESGSKREDTTTDTLQKYRETYERNERSGSGMDIDREYRPRAASVADPEDMEDFVEAAMAKRKRAKQAREQESREQTDVESQGQSQAASVASHRKNAPELEVEDEDEEMPEVPEEAEPVKRTKAAKEPREPVLRKTGMDQDDTFLKIVAKQKSKKPENEFDRDFNNLKISKTGTKQLMPGNEAALYDLAALADPGVTGNFTKITRIALYQKPSGGTVPNEDFAGRPNFKKFKKQHIIRRDPVALSLAPAADFGLGSGYLFGRGENPTRTAQSQSQANGTQSQVLLPPSQAVAGPSTAGKGKAKANKRKTLVVESDEEDQMVVPVAKRKAGTRNAAVGRSQTAETNETPFSVPGPSPEPPARTTRKRKQTTPPPSVGGTVVLDSGSDDDAGPAKRTRRRGSVASTASVGDSEMVERGLGRSAKAGRSGTGTTTTSTAGTARNRKKQLLAVDEEDDDQMVVVNRRKRH